MYIAIPHRGRPHWGRECSGGHDISDGVDKCEADCDGCRDLRDSHCCLGTTSTTPAELAALVRDYHGHQRAAVVALACGDCEVTEHMQEEPSRNT